MKKGGRVVQLFDRRGDNNTPLKGRDYHADAFTMFIAGTGIKKGFLRGKTDEIEYYVVKGKTHIHDLQATIMHVMGFDHEQFTFLFFDEVLD
ncbi:MAG: DUF1501 domain-containing protein [Emticicia sp.]|nr:DUF1501 domain-containing protein [Emticicia sp.]